MNSGYNPHHSPTFSYRLLVPDRDVMSQSARLITVLGRGIPKPTPRSRIASTVSQGSAFATQASGAPRFQVFNRKTKWLQKERSGRNAEESRQADYLKDEIAARLTDRLLVSIVPSTLRRRFTRL